MLKRRKFREYELREYKNGSSFKAILPGSSRACILGSEPQDPPTIPHCLTELNEENGFLPFMDLSHMSFNSFHCHSFI